ncbi:KRAB-A domain-containing protein 2-like [Palaemon carinicauda]|uniref:KRAB-A domain-containing protein 2-like n=1 Tax=Palaemon carinicauda TaxID=392227 RepID=UPI0035B5DF71
MRDRVYPSKESPLYYVSIEETFGVVKSAHISTGHGGRDRMLKELQKKYANIPTKAVELFKSLCQECQKKRKRPMMKGVVFRPILTKEFSSRGQEDLIDMQSMPSGSNKKWIMVYQDHRTKFYILRALTSKRAAEVAFHLLDIFPLFGPPVILQNDNGSEFTSQAITELKEVWPKLTLVHGPSSPTATPSAHNVESSVSSGESEEPVDKASQNATVLAPKSVVQGDVNALKLDFCVTHDVIAASIVVTSNMSMVSAIL